MRALRPARRPRPAGRQVGSAERPPLEIGVPYDVRYSSRAKRLQAVVRAGRIEVVVPRWARPRHVRAFLRAARPWMLEKAALLAAAPGTILPATLEPGAPVLVEGQPRRLRIERAVEAPAVDLEGDVLTVRPAAGAEGERESLVRDALRGWLERRAHAKAEASIARHAARLGVTPAGLRIKAQKTLWGSCGRRGVIHLNWRLIGAPPDVFEYIVVHELCHLRERNHGPRFWRLVREILPDYERHRRWLRTHGAGLG